MISKRRTKTQTAHDLDMHKYFQSLQFKDSKQSKRASPSPFALPNIHSSSTHTKPQNNNPKKTNAQLVQTTHILNDFIHNYFKRKTGNNTTNTPGLPRSLSTIKAKEMTLKRMKHPKLNRNQKRNIIEADGVDIYFKTDWE